jgi:hypothetical protein
MPSPTSRHPLLNPNSITQPTAACLGGRGEDRGTAPEKMPCGGERLNGEVIHCCATSPRQRGLPPPWNPPFQGRAALKIPCPKASASGLRRGAVLADGHLAQPCAGWMRGLGRRPSRVATLASGHRERAVPKTLASVPLPSTAKNDTVVT